MQTFRSKIDLWLIIILAAAVALPVFIIGGDPIGQNAAWIAAAITAAVFLWLIFATKYVVSDNRLIIHGGFNKTPIPLASIKSATPSRDLAASPALSLDRILITYGSNKTVLVSPKDKTGFLAAIGQA